VKRSTNIAELFPPHLFWEMDMSCLDAARDKDLIIPRALIATNPESFETDIKRLENIYSNREIINELKSARERISNKLCEMVSDRYHIPVFKRYSLR